VWVFTLNAYNCQIWMIVELLFFQLKRIARQLCVCVGGGGDSLTPMLSTVFIVKVHCFVYQFFTNLPK
jgi:hypothetical protein